MRCARAALGREVGVSSFVSMILLMASYLYHLFLICKITKMLQNLHNAPKTAQLISLVYLLPQFVAILNKHFPLGGDLLFYGKLSWDHCDD